MPMAWAGGHPGSVASAREVAIQAEAERDGGDGDDRERSYWRAGHHEHGDHGDVADHAQDSDRVVASTRRGPVSGSQRTRRPVAARVPSAVAIAMTIMGMAARSE